MELQLSQNIPLYQSKIKDQVKKQAQFILARLLIDAALKQLQEQIYRDENVSFFSLSQVDKQRIKKRKDFFNPWIHSEYNLLLNPPQINCHHDTHDLNILISINNFLDSNNPDIVLFKQESEDLLKNSPDFSEFVNHQHVLIRQYYSIAYFYKKEKIALLEEYLMALSRISFYEEIIHESILSYLDEETSSMNRMTLERASLNAQYPALLSQPDVPLISNQTHMPCIEGIIQKSSINKTLQQELEKILNTVQENIAKILELESSSHLDKIKTAILNRKQYFVLQKTGRNSLLHIFSALELLMHHNKESLNSLSIESGEINLAYFYLLKNKMAHRFSHLESLEIMNLKKTILLDIKKGMNQGIERMIYKIYIQLGQRHLSFLAHGLNPLPIEKYLDQSMESIQLNHQMHYIRHFKKTYNIIVPDDFLFSHLHVWLMEKHQLPGDYYSPRYVISKTVLKKYDIGLFVTLAYAYNTHQGKDRISFIPVIWTPQGLSIHPELKANNSRYADLITIIQDLSVYPALYLTILMLTIELMRHHRASKEYARLYQWLSLVLNQHYYKILEEDHQKTKEVHEEESDDEDDANLSWLSAYLPNHVEAISYSRLSALRYQLIGKKSSLKTGLFLPPKKNYGEESLIQELSIEDILCNTTKLPNSHSSFSISRPALSELSLTHISLNSKKLCFDTLEEFKTNIKKISRLIMSHFKDWSRMDNQIEGDALSSKALNTIYYQCNNHKLSKELGILYVLIIWYIERRHQKLNSVESSRYQGILALLHSIHTALSPIFEGKKAPSLDIFTPLINYQTQSLPHSACQLRKKIMEFIPFLEIEYSLNDHEIAISKQAIPIFKNLTPFFKQEFQATLSNTVTALLLEYRGGNDETILSLSLLLAYQLTPDWQKIQYASLNYPKSHDFIDQFNELILRYYLALDGHETHFSSYSLLMFPSLDWIQEEYSRGIGAIFDQIKTFTKKENFIEEKQPVHPPFEFYRRPSNSNPISNPVANLSNSFI